MPPLSELQLRTLVAAIDRIVPADEFPSASQAGCDEFLLRLIQLEDLVDTYRTGLDGLNVAAMKSGTPFADCTATLQDQILDNGQRTKASRAFIDLLVRQTIEGYYADPGNGGNRDEIAWQMVGFRVTA